jgi:hypothetical protein
VRFIAAALKGRDPAVVAAALSRGQLDALMDTPPLQPLIKTRIEETLFFLQDHWSARHAVFLMSEVHLSRDEIDTLRHLLSFVYSPERDKYERLVLWVNPHDSEDCILSPTLAARGPREAMRAEIYARCGSAASDDGLYCGRVDFEAAAVGLVEHFWRALHKDVKSGRVPLLLVLTGDATGGWRGSPVTHGELGIGSFAAGKAQSRLTLLPLFIMEGDDSAKNLRNRARPVADGYNTLKKKGKLTVTIDGKQITLAVTLVAAADFQFFKAIMNMSKYTSAVSLGSDVERAVRDRVQA